MGRRVNLKASLPPGCRYNLNNPPSAGGGLNTYILKTAKSLEGHCTRERAISLLRKMAKDAGRKPGRKLEIEIERQLDTAWSGRDYQRQCVEASAESDLELISRIEDQGRKLGDNLEKLKELSPRKLNDRQRWSATALRMLFPGDPLLCTSCDQMNGVTEPRTHWQHPSRLSHIVAAPMTAKFGLTQGGKQSQHSLSNTGPRRFLVQEFDNKPLDDQAAIIIHLMRHDGVYPAIIVFSGNESLHTWWFVGHLTEADPEEATLVSMKQQLLRLGSCKGPINNRHQFVRMPDGTREKTGARQEIIFVNPDYEKEAVKPNNK